MDAEAARGTIGPIDASDKNRCEVSAFDKFAETRAAFSQESAGGNMVEAIVDVRECDFSNQDLSGKVGRMRRGACVAYCTPPPRTQLHAPTCAKTF